MKVRMRIDHVTLIRFFFLEFFPGLMHTAIEKNGQTDKHKDFGIYEVFLIDHLISQPYLSPIQQPKQ